MKVKDAAVGREGEVARLAVLGISKHRRVVGSGRLRDCAVEAEIDILELHAGGDGKRRVRGDFDYRQSDRRDARITRRRQHRVKHRRDRRLRGIVAKHDLGRRVYRERRQCDVCKHFQRRAVAHGDRGKRRKRRRVGDRRHCRGAGDLHILVRRHGSVRPAVRRAEVGELIRLEHVVRRNRRKNKVYHGVVAVNGPCGNRPRRAGGRRDCRSRRNSRNRPFVARIRLGAVHHDYRRLSAVVDESRARKRIVVAGAVAPDAPCEIAGEVDAAKGHGICGGGGVVNGRLAVPDDRSCPRRVGF